MNAGLRVGVMLMFVPFMRIPRLIARAPYLATYSVLAEATHTAPSGPIAGYVVSSSAARRDCLIEPSLATIWSSLPRITASVPSAKAVARSGSVEADDQ